MEDSTKIFIGVVIFSLIGGLLIASYSNFTYTTNYNLAKQYTAEHINSNMSYVDKLKTIELNCKIYVSNNGIMSENQVNSCIKDMVRELNLT